MMLIVPVSMVEATFFFVLFVIWAGSLVGEFTIGFSSKPGDDQMPQTPRWTRLSASMALLVAAWLWSVVTLGTRANGLAIWIAIGMSASFAGEIILAQILTPTRPSLLSIVTFSLTHIAFVIGLLHIDLAVTLSLALVTSTAIWIVTGIISWYILLYRHAEKRGRMLNSFLPYFVLLATSTGITTGFALQNPAFLLMALGMSLLFITTLLSAMYTFNRLRLHYSPDIIWLLYSPAQMLITFGILIYTLIADPTILT